MAAPVAKIGVQLSATTGQFENKLGNAAKRTRQLENTMERAKGKVPGFGNALGGIGGKGALAAAGAAAAAAGVVGVVLVARKAIQTFKRLGGAIIESISAMDNVIKTSRKLGITTSALVAMRIAANRTGTDLGQMEKGVQRMARSVSEAAKGTGEAQDAIRELGLDAKRLNTLSADKQFAAIGGALEGIVNHNDKLRIAGDIFGSRSAGDLLLLLGNVEAVQQAMFDAGRFGVIIDPAQTAAIEKANDAMEDLRTIKDGVFQQIAAKAAPVVAWGIEELTKRLEGPNSIPALVGRAMAKVREMAVMILNRIHTRLAFVQGVFEGIRERITNIANTVKTVWAAVASTIGTAFDALRAKLDGTQGIWEKVKATATRVIDEIAKHMATVINLIIAGTERVVNAAVGPINKLIGAANKVPGVNIGSASRVRFERVNPDTLFSDAGKALAAAAKTAAPTAIGAIVAGPLGTLLGGSVKDGIATAMAQGGGPRWGDKLDALLTRISQTPVMGGAGAMGAGAEAGAAFDPGNFAQGKLAFTALPGVNSPGLDAMRRAQDQTVAELKRSNTYLASMAENMRGGQVAVAG